ncbi:Pvc16 family protein [Actinomycetospora lemnae]|uniref:Pvc16 family protein n=1 Tax=Actinomycetospora lemnae TaxID=3019891 RepID=A0ABT5STH8_9PSEU|nr:Pvc16 family protein [Actinomycetospora sp. DW7H6]MDD7965476.1 Pvc16 family protein [Actinomycetospora sp. DW7H6]
MAGHAALAATMRSIVELLDRRFRATIPPGDRRPSVVMVGTADLEAVGTPGAQIAFPAVSVYCYRISVDRETRPGWSAVAAADGIPRIPLRMHLLLTAWDDFVENELRWLGLTASVLEAENLLQGPTLHPDGGFAAEESLQIVPDDMALESMSEAFQALTADFRTYLLYQVRVVVIEGAGDDDGGAVTTVAARAQALR